MPGVYAKVHAGGRDVGAVANLLTLLGRRDGLTAELASTMVERYAHAASAPDPIALRWYVRVELLQRAFGALKTLRPGWQDDARTLVEIALGDDVDLIVSAAGLPRGPG
jgi:hypothetical protein